MSCDRPATVWSSTFVPSKSPILGFGEDGYSVAWVDAPDGREQVLVSGSQPAPGARGRIILTPIADVTVELFVADPS